MAFFRRRSGLFGYPSTHHAHKFGGQSKTKRGTGVWRRPFGGTTPPSNMEANTELNLVLVSQDGHFYRQNGIFGEIVWLFGLARALSPCWWGETAFLLYPWSGFFYGS